jgi:hypothetical protein
MIDDYINVTKQIKRFSGSFFSNSKQTDYRRNKQRGGDKASGNADHQERTQADESPIFGDHQTAEAHHRGQGSEQDCLPRAPEHDRCSIKALVFITVE